jgi:hypothetical protein
MHVEAIAAWLNDAAYQSPISNADVTRRATAR